MHTHRRPTPSRLGVLFGAGLLALAIAPLSSVEAANIAGPRRGALDRLEDGDAIRHRLELRGGRFEVAPILGFTLNDAFQRNMLAGVHLGYNFDEAWGVGLTVLGGLPFNSGLADQIEAKRSEKVEGDAFGTVALLGSIEGSYAPLSGKFAVFGRSVFHYDLHLLAGVGVTKTGGEGDLDAIAPAPMFGVGVRTFISQAMTVNIEVRDYMYSSALNTVTEPGAGGELTTDSESAFSNNFSVTVGVGFYFPQEPTVGR